MTLEIQILAWNRHTLICGWVNQLMGSQHSPHDIHHFLLIWYHIVYDWLINLKNGSWKNCFWLATKCENGSLKIVSDWLINVKNGSWKIVSDWLINVNNGSWKIVSDWLINVENGSWIFFYDWLINLKMAHEKSVLFEPQVYYDDLEKLWFMLRPIIQYQIISSTLRRFIY